MDRRRFLAGLAAGLAASGTGCSGSDRGGAAATATPTAGDGTAFDGPRDVALPLDESDLVRAAGRDEIPAIVDPAFGGDWSAVPETLGDRDRVIGDTNPYGDYETYQPPDPSRDGSGRRLPAKELVLGVATDGTARAYPFRSVVEAGGVVNDRSPMFWFAWVDFFPGTDVYGESG